MRLLVVMALLLASTPAYASFHAMKVVEVFAGSTTQPNAQYVVLQMVVVNQNQVQTHTLHVFDAAGVPVTSFTFTMPVMNGATQSKILIATAEAQALFGITADLTIAPVLQRAAGKVCWQAVDCVAWGTYNKPIGDSSVGTPVNSPVAPIAGQPNLGLVLNRAIIRRLDIVAPPTTLQNTDDTNNCANDFVLGAPAPRNNAGLVGTAMSTCGNSAIEGLESCDDGDAMGGDGCSAACADEFCGDLAINDTSETCDDGNATSGDGCDANCTTTACGNGVITAGEACDDGDLQSGDGCDANCTATACGNAVVTAGEACDDGDLESGDGCDANCTVTACGNGIVTAGEACEPPGQGTCSATCQVGCGSAAECADADPCTTNERCVVASCIVDPTPTDDAEPCTVDSCGVGGVHHDPLADGATCTLPGDPTRALCVSAICVVASCGDGFVDLRAPGGPEQCDDANVIDDDACTNACTIPRCGDAIRQLDEECDDGGIEPDDGCSAACAIERCGDGLEQAGEECDDGGLEPDDGCTILCTIERCGDGFMQPAEGCDDGNELDGDGCSAACAIERCGDGVVQDPEECDDGNTTPGDGCSDGCSDEAVPPAGGCCGTTGGPGAALLALLVLGVIARPRSRRRSRSA